MARNGLYRVIKHELEILHSSIVETYELNLISDRDQPH